MWPNPQFPADLDIFTEEISNAKLHFCSVVQPLLNASMKLKTSAHSITIRDILLFHTKKTFA